MLPPKSPGMPIVASLVQGVRLPKTKQFSPQSCTKKCGLEWWNATPTLKLEGDNLEKKTTRTKGGFFLVVHHQSQLSTLPETNNYCRPWKMVVGKRSSLLFGVLGRTVGFREGKEHFFVISKTKKEITKFWWTHCYMGATSSTSWVYFNGNSWRRPLRWNTRPMEHNHVVSMIRSLIKAHREAGEMRNRQRAVWAPAAFLCQSLVFSFYLLVLCTWAYLQVVKTRSLSDVRHFRPRKNWPTSRRAVLTACEQTRDHTCMVYFPKLIWFLS